MRDTCKCALREFMSKELLQYLKSHDLTQAEVAEELMIDPRSYVDLEHGKSLCCALTLILYLDDCCDDPMGLLHDCRKVIKQALEQLSMDKL